MLKQSATFFKGIQQIITPNCKIYSYTSNKILQAFLKQENRTHNHFPAGKLIHSTRPKNDKDDGISR